MCYIAVLNKVIDFLEQNKEGKSPLHIAAMHGRFTGSQILIQNGNINAPDTPITHRVLYNMYLSCLLLHCMQVERSTVLISMETLLFMLLPDMVRSYWSALYCQMVLASPGKTIQTKLQFNNDGTKTQVSLTHWKKTERWTKNAHINLLSFILVSKEGGLMGCFRCI